MTARKLASGLDAAGKRITNLPSPTGGSTEATRQIDLETARTFAISRTNHTGTQLASTISNFTAAVQAIALNTLAVPTGPLALNAQRITGMADPTAAQDAATKNYVDNQITGLSSGQTLKGTVRVLVKTNINITSPGTSFDGVTLTAGDVAWLGAQTTGTEGGPWVFNGGTSAMTRPANWNTTARAQVGSYWIVTAGTSADTILLLTNDTFTLGTDTPAYKVIDVAAASAPVFEQSLGDGTATSFVITHNFNTRNVHLQIRRVASPFDAIHEDVYYEYTSLNTITVSPDEVWSSGQYTAIVAKM